MDLTFPVNYITSGNALPLIALMYLQDSYQLKKLRGSEYDKKNNLTIFKLFQPCFIDILQNESFNFKQQNHS